MLFIGSGNKWRSGWMKKGRLWNFFKQVDEPLNKYIFYKENLHLARQKSLYPIFLIVRKTARYNILWNKLVYICTLAQYGRSFLQLIIPSTDLQILTLSTNLLSIKVYISKGRLSQLLCSISKLKKLINEPLVLKFTIILIVHNTFITMIKLRQ